MYLVRSTQNWHKWFNPVMQFVCGYMLRNSLWNPIENSSYLPFYKPRWVWNSQSVWRVVVFGIFYVLFMIETERKLSWWKTCMSSITNMNSHLSIFGTTTDTLEWRHMIIMAYQITGYSIVCSMICSNWQQNDTKAIPLWGETQVIRKAFP